MQSVFSRAGGCCLILLSALLCGCGSSTGSVKGKVSYKSAPVDYGSVVFLVGDKHAIKAEIGPDGSYEAKGVPYGEAEVEVYSRSASAEGTVAPARHTKGGKEPPAPVAAKGVAIPENYNDRKKSGLKVTIQKGLTEFNIELKDPE